MSGGTGYTVRRASLADLEQVAPLFDDYRQFYGQPADLVVARQFLFDRLSRGESVVLLAYDAPGAAVGFVQLFPSFSSSSVAPIYILNDLFVTVEARRRGVGRLLMEAAARCARDDGAVRLRLSTAVTNVPAQKLYERMGWKRNEEFYVYGLRL